jgi:hypothetical protein
MEAEYMSLCVATQEVMFLRQLLIELSIVLPLPTSMMEDIKGCIAFAKNSMTPSKSKYINVKLHFVRDAIYDNVSVMQWCSTHDMIADILTKNSLPGHQLARLASGLMSGYFSMSKAML